ncbi:MAG: glycogen synthase GlgA [Candidatus Competibacterales bacterium]|nr:glycogen synthase GlgA [Candidatus Competibacterales bacterium]
MGKPDPLRICLATAELAPLAKTGGLADVSSALSAYFHQAGHDVRVLMPLYSRIDPSALDLQPVGAVQDAPMRIGHHEYRYSIYRSVLPGSELPVHFLACPELYDRDGIYTQEADEYRRFVLLSRAAIEMCQRMAFSPDIFHCHDWHTALIPLYLKTRYGWDQLFANTRSVLTIHNIGYQGMVPAEVLPDLGFDYAEHRLHQDDLKAGVINFMKTGLLYADLITTVSPTYAREIQTSDYGMGLQDLLRHRSQSVIGILNGVDYDEWNPETDPLIPANYSADDLSGKAECKQHLAAEMGLVDDRPMVGIVSRLVGQKGIELIEQTIAQLLWRRGFVLAVLGSGEPHYERFFTLLQQYFPGQVCFYRGYNNELSHWIEAGSDIFLMPSRYEPCGLNQMYSLKYGTVPIVRQTGGLADSVEMVNPSTGTGTGVVFRDYDATGLSWAVNTALDLYEQPALWDRIVANGMAKDFSWERQGDRYIQLFRQLTGKPA